MFKLASMIVAGFCWSAFFPLLILKIAGIATITYSFVFAFLWAPILFILAMVVLDLFVESLAKKKKPFKLG